MRPSVTMMTIVRMKVARSESICSTPTLAKIAVSAAKTAERSAQTIQFYARLVMDAVSR
jgi:hypothetical protein